MFADPWNPSSTEVRAWAYSVDAMDPCQDWDLALSWAGHERDYLHFVADPDCPTGEFFLKVIYLMVGDAVRCEYRNVSEPTVRGFVALAMDSKCEVLRLWHARSNHLLNHPSEFEYDAWCGGGLARTRT